MSLAGRRVVVTRAAAQAQDLVTLLEAAGAIPVVVPLIEIVAVDSELATLSDLDLSDFDWVVVTSPNGAKYLSPSPAKVAAVGQATAEVLRQGGVAVDLIPTVQSAQGLLAEFKGSGTVLLIQAADADPALATGLRERGLAVTVIAPYRAVPAKISAAQQLRVLSADAVLFASGSAARAWVNAFSDASPPIVIAIGPQTAAAATRAGLKVTAIAADHSLSGMVSALERELSSNR